MPRRRFAIRSISLGMRKNGVTIGTGSRSIIIFPVSQARRHRSLFVTSPAEQNAFGLARAVSCCQITRRSLSPSNSAHSSHSFRAGLISASGALRGAINSRLTRCAATSAAAAILFREDVLELKSYFRPATPDQALRAVPGAGLNVPLYLLGSSDFSARLAAELGLPFAFASHFAPEYLLPALALYRRNFKPSPELEKPHAMIGVGVFAAETDTAAQRLFTSAQMQFLNLIRGHPSELPPPVDTMEGRWTRAEQLAVAQRTRCSAVGSPETVRRRIEELLEETNADEIIATAQIYDHTARLRSFEIAAKVFQEIVAKSET